MNECEMFAHPVIYDAKLGQWFKNTPGGSVSGAYDSVNAGFWGIRRGNLISFGGIT